MSPDELRGPVELALAKAVERMPGHSAQPGGCVFEPKWNGFKAQLVRDGERTAFYSRQGKDLTRYFPDFWATTADAVPSGVVADGELVGWLGERLDFDALQRRMTTSKRTLADLVRNEPASFVAFDVLADPAATPLDWRGGIGAPCSRN